MATKSNYRKINWPEVVTSSKSGPKLYKLKNGFADVVISTWIYCLLGSEWIRVDLSFLRSEFAWNLLGIHSEFTRTRILPFHSEFYWNGRDLVGMSLSQK